MTTSAVTDATRPRMFDVFLSHNSREKPAVERIAEWLKRDGIEPWLDKWCLTPGGDWQDELAEGLRRSNSCAVFVGPAGVGDWERLEFKLATDRMAKDRNFRVFLVLLPGIPEPFDTSSLPPFLTTRTWVDMRKGVADPRAFQNLINAVRGVAPGPETPIEARNDVCPYRGLRAFDEEHSEFFFGRDADIQRLVEKLKTTRFLAVLGPSGSGKSSVVRAGLIPALRKGAVPGSEAWRVQVFTPGARPLMQLAANLVRLHPQSSSARTLDELAADERALHLACSVALAERPESERVVWVVDQFEEVFTLCRDEAERARFVSNLLYAAGVPGGRGLVVFTMRADFYQKCTAYPEFSAQVSAQQFLVSPMSTEGLRQAIAEPAWRTGLEFEQGMVETVLEDVEGQPGALPLLEHALLELWERRRGRLLTLEAYRETGGVEGAIAKRADAVFEAFDAERQSITRRIMLRLTQPGEGTEDTRRRATLAELVTQPDEAEKVQDVVTALADARLLTTGAADEEGGPEIIDVAHEALIRSWPRLRRWVEEDRQGLRTHRRVTEAAGEWQRAGRDESLLFRGARLAQTLEWRERHRSALNETERAFLDASAEVQEHERRAAQRRTHLIVVGLVAALILISAASIYALVQRQIAAQRDEEVFARGLAASALVQLSLDPELSLSLAVEAARLARLPETETTLRQVLAKAPRHVLRTSAPASDTDLSTANYGKKGKLVALTNGKDLRAFDAESGRPVFERHLEPTAEHSVISPHSDLIAVSFVITDDTKGPEGVQLWEAGTGRLVTTLQTSVPAFRTTFSPDEKFLAAEWDEGCEVFEVSSGNPVAKIEGRAPSFNSDGRFLLTTNHSSEKPRLFVTDTSNWRRVAEIPSTVGPSVAEIVGAISPDGRHVVVGSNDGAVRLHEARGGRALLELQTNEWAGRLTHVAFSPDGRFIAIAANTTLFLWDTGESEDVGLQELSEGVGTLSGLSFSSDGRFLVGVSETARVYAVKSSRLVAEYRAVGGATALRAEFSPDSRSVLTVNSDGTAYVWDLTSARAQAVLPAVDASSEVDSSDLITSVVTFSPDGRLAARVKTSNDGESAVHIWEVGANRPVQVLRHAEEFVSVSFSPDGQRLLTASEESAQVWELDMGRIVTELRHGEGLAGAAFSHNGNQVVTWGGPHGAQIWGVGDGRRLAEVAAGGEVTSAAFSPDGTRLLLIESGQARVWDIAGQRVAFEVSESLKVGEPGGLERAVYSPDGRYALMWEDVDIDLRRNKLQVRDANTGRAVVDLHGRLDNIHSATISPNGEYVLTTSGFYLKSRDERTPLDELNTVRIWELRSGGSFYNFGDHGGQMLAGQFAADGKSVLALNHSGTTYVYSCELCVSQEELLRLAERRNIRPLTPDERARYLRE